MPTTTPPSVQSDQIFAATAQWHCLDVRSPSEFAAGHIASSTNIPLEQLDSRLADLPAGRQLLLICGSGQRATVAYNLLSSRGLEAHLLTGGVQAWSNAGLPLVRTTASQWALERQVRLTAGVLILASMLLGAFVSHLWFFLTASVGAGLTFSGLTDICGMAILLSRLPWNRPAPRPSSCRAQ
jgi:rhodanese-related sulfurtransferase